MAKKQTKTQNPVGYSEEFDPQTGEMIYSATEKGKDTMNQMSVIFEFVGPTCNATPTIADTSIEKLSDRFCFESELLPAVKERIAVARAGQRVPTKEFEQLLADETNLTQKDLRLGAFWFPKVSDTVSIQRRDMALAVLQQMLTPVETLNRRRVFKVTKDGEEILQTVNIVPVREATKPVSVAYSHKGAQRIGELLSTLRQSYIELVLNEQDQVTGLYIQRPKTLKGETPALLYVGNTADLPCFTVGTDKYGRPTMLPFSPNVDHSYWQVAALMVLGHEIQVVVDPGEFNERVFNQTIVDQIAITDFKLRWGQSLMPYTKQAFAERWASPQVAKMPDKVEAEEARSVFEF